VNSDVLLNKNYFSTSPSNSAQQTIFTAVSMLIMQTLSRIAL